MDIDIYLQKYIRDRDRGKVRKQNESPKTSNQVNTFEIHGFLQTASIATHFLALVHTNCIVNYQIKRLQYVLN